MKAKRAIKINEQVATSSYRFVICDPIITDQLRKKKQKQIFDRGHYPDDCYDIDLKQDASQSSHTLDLTSISSPNLHGKYVILAFQLASILKSSLV